MFLAVDSLDASTTSHSRRHGDMFIWPSLWICIYNGYMERGRDVLMEQEVSLQVILKAVRIYHMSAGVFSLRKASKHSFSD